MFVVKVIQCCAFLSTVDKDIQDPSDVIDDDDDEMDV